MAETNQLLCKSDIMPKSNDSEDENKWDAAMLGRIGQTPTFLKCPSCYFPFSIFFGIDVSFAWKNLSNKIVKTEGKMAFSVFPPTVLGRKTY